MLEILDSESDIAGGQAALVHARDGSIEHATRMARQLLREWFGTSEGRLPSNVAKWVARARPGATYTEKRPGCSLMLVVAGDGILTLQQDSTESASLTPRERQILQFVAQGLTNRQIAAALVVAESTVAKHLAQAYPKLGVHSRTAAIARMRQTRQNSNAVSSDPA